VPQPVNIGYTNEVLAPQGTGLVREEGYVEKTTKVKETFNQPTVM